MAKDKEEVIEAVEEAPKGKGKKKLIIILVSAVLLVVVLVVGFLVFFPNPEATRVAMRQWLKKTMARLSMRIWSPLR